MKSKFKKLLPSKNKPHTQMYNHYKVFRMRVKNRWNKSDKKAFLAEPLEVSSAPLFRDFWRSAPHS